jgi:hypothetical protein
MKKSLIAIVASIALMFAFIAPAQASAPTGLRDDKLFVKLVTAEAPTLKGIPRKTMVKTAKQVCKYLRAGFTILDAVYLMEDNDFTENESMSFVAGAVVFYCPEQEDNF